MPGMALPSSTHQESSNIIVMAHGIGAPEELRLDAFAERFVEKGYACLDFDYRHLLQFDLELDYQVLTSSRRT